jgi:hypothetical protein
MGVRNAQKIRKCFFLDRGIKFIVCSREAVTLVAVYQRTLYFEREKYGQENCLHWVCSPARSSPLP